MLLLKDAIMEYELECKVRRLSQGTIENYDRHLRYLRRYPEDECGVTRLKDVKPAHLKRFLPEKEELGRKPQYINDLLKVFKTFFRYCVEEEYLKVSPAARVKNVRQPRVLIRTFSEEEVLKMLNYHSGHGARRFFINWRLAGGLFNRYRFRARGPAAGDRFLLIFRPHIGGELGRSIEIHGVLLAVPHGKAARREKVFYRTTVAAVRDIQAFLKVGGAERQFVCILVAAQVEIHAEGYSGW